MARRPLQVIVLGHALSAASKTYLKTQGPYRVFKIMFHIEKFSEVEKSVAEVFTELEAMGCDTSGNTPTVFQVSGSSVGTAVVIAWWTGLTGNLPNILNLIRIGDSSYGPSPELPQIELEAVAQRAFEAECAKYGIRVVSEDQQSAEANAVEDGLEFDTVMRLSTVRNEARKLRFNSRVQHVAQQAAQREVRAGA